MERPAAVICCLKILTTSYRENVVDWSLNRRILGGHGSYTNSFFRAAIRHILLPYYKNDLYTSVLHVSLALFVNLILCRLFIKKW